MRRFYQLFVLAGAACMCSAAAVAQTKFTASHECSKPDPQHALPAGDRPEHSFTVEKLKCNFTKPMELGADKAKDAVATETVEASGNKLRVRGMFVTTMGSGDKVFLPYQGTGTTKDGKPTESKGTWSYSGGTGKLKGITGKGTYNCTPSGDGWKCDVEGEYQLAK